MDVSECAFCQLPLERDRLRRDYELDICDPCACGHAPAALRERGYSLAKRTWETERRSDSRNVTIYHLEVAAHSPGDFAVTATFTRENFLDKLTKLFRKELQVGDPIFDDFVFIRTHDRVQTTALLQSSGAQSALMALVSSFDHVNFIDGSFTVYKQRTSPVSMSDDDLLAVCALLVHVERSHLHQS